MGSTTGSGVGGPPVADRSPAGGGPVLARRSDLVAAIAGLVFIVLVIGSFFTPDTPAADGSAEGIAGALTADRNGHQMSLLLGFLADIAFFVFLAGLWSRFRRWEGHGGMAAALFGLAGATFVALILVSEGLYLALVKAAEELSDPAGLPALAVLNNWVGAATVPAAVAMFIGAAAAILVNRALPTALGWLAALTGVLLLVSLAGIFQSGGEEGAIDFAGFGGYLLFMIWVLTTSVVLLLRSRSEAHAAA